MSRTHSRFAGVLAVAALILVRAAGGQDSRVDSAPSSAPSRLFHPSARWIWDASAPPVDAYRVFRKTFTLKGPPFPPSRIRITAETEYRLYVNGAQVGRGPAPSPAGRASVDEFTLGNGALHNENAIAVVVHWVGAPTFARVMGRPGLIAELEAPGLRVVTDSSWRVRDAWWAPTGERLTPMREFTEHLDGRRENEALWASYFNDSSWPAATEIGPEGIAPWTVLEPRDIPMPHEDFVKPVAIVFHAGCSGAIPPKRDAAKALAGMPGGPLIAGAVLDGTRVFGSEGAGGLRPGPDGGAVIGLDFGRVVSGFPSIWAEAATDGIVLDVGYGEGLDAAGRVTVFHQNYPDCDRMTLRKGGQNLGVFHHRAFRYVVVAVRGGALDQLMVGVETSGYPVHERGSFSCSDKDLVRIWEAGRETTRLCMDQGFMDCPWRERGQYVGDAIVEAPVALYAFGDTKLARRFLRQAQFCQPADGLLEPAYPCDWTSWHGARGPNRIPGYGALWVVLLDDWLTATDDADLARQLLLVMDRQLAWFAPLRGPDGLLASAPEWNFIDWAQLDERTALACLNLQYLMALRAAARIEARLGQRTGLDSAAHKVASAFRTAHWDEEKGLFRDAEGIYSAHTNALALLALVDDAATARRVLDGIVDGRPGSPYFDGYVLRALAKHGFHKEALGIIRKRWLPMLKDGPGTLWEMYSKDASLCHGWSSAPTSFLQREILGLSYDAPSKTVRFAPRLGGLEWAAATAPFSCGEVSARARTEGTRPSASVDTPSHVTLVLDLQAEPDTVLVVNGERSAAKLEGGSFRLTLPGGSYRFSVTRP